MRHIRFTPETNKIAAKQVKHPTIAKYRNLQVLRPEECVKGRGNEEVSSENERLALYKAQCLMKSLNKNDPTLQIDMNIVETIKPIKPKAILVGTDCSGIDTPLLALKAMHVEHTHALLCHRAGLVETQL